MYQKSKSSLTESSPAKKGKSKKTKTKTKTTQTAPMCKMHHDERVADYEGALNFEK